MTGAPGVVEVAGVAGVTGVACRSSRNNRIDRSSLCCRSDGRGINGKIADW